MIRIATRRPAADLLCDLIRIHLENTGALVRQTRRFLKSVPHGDPFWIIFSLLLRRNVNRAEADILENLGTIQIHHGSAGSNMVARYFASLHTRSASDLFVAGQMALDCARHFGAITEL